jgi:hypothetical protein
MEIFNFVNVRDLQKVSLEIVSLYLLWGLFHQNTYTLDEGGDSREHHQNRKYKGTNWINDKVIRLVHNNNSGDDHTNGLEQITDKVNNCSLDVNVDRLFVMVLVIVIIM